MLNFLKHYSILIPIAHPLSTYIVIFPDTWHYTHHKAPYKCINNKMKFSNLSTQFENSYNILKQIALKSWCWYRFKHNTCLDGCCQRTRAVRVLYQDNRFLKYLPEVSSRIYLVTLKEQTRQDISVHSQRLCSLNDHGNDKKTAESASHIDIVNQWTDAVEANDVEWCVFITI